VLAVVVVAVLTAWPVFQATKWSSVQAKSYSSAGAARTEAVCRSDAAGTLTAIGVDTFIAWVTALAEEYGGLEPSTKEDYEPTPGTLSGFLSSNSATSFSPRSTCGSRRDRSPSRTHRPHR